MATPKTCPCGSKQSFDACCGKYISGKENAPTAEALMRARYSAYVVHDVDFVDRTHDPSSGDQFDREAAKAWSEKSEWLGLEVVDTHNGREGDAEGEVEFIAKFKTEGQEYAHHERSLFSKSTGKWLYVEGKTIQKPFKREEPKIGRNDPCSCGSGKKFKKCCGTAA